MDYPLTHLERFKITPFDACFDRKLSATALFGFLEEAATNHAKRLGFSYESSLGMGFFWMIRSAKYKLLRPIELDEVLTVKTWPGGIHGLKALRNFSLMVGNEIVGKGYHYWLMYDIKKQKPVVNPQFNDVMLSLPIKTSDFFRLDKVKLPEVMMYGYEKNVRIYDIDWNGHVNNVKYITMIYNTLSKALIDQYDILAFQIDYLQESKYQDKIQFHYQQEGKKVYVQGLCEGETRFKAALELEEKK